MWSFLVLYVRSFRGEGDRPAHVHIAGRRVSVGGIQTISIRFRTVLGTDLIREKVSGTIEKINIVDLYFKVT